MAWRRPAIGEPERFAEMRVTELIVRFLIGGAIVSAFATLGDLFHPKSFAGLFGAAPSVALATLGLTIVENGKLYASTEGRSMLAGGAALFCYTSAVSWTMMRYKTSALWTTVAWMPAWFACAFGLWFACLR